MRKLLIFIFITLLLVLPLTACGDTPADTTPSGSDPTPGNNTPASNYYRITGDTKMEQGFQLTGKKYTYKNKDCLLVDVENKTDKNYTVSLRVHYFDAEGKEIKSQKQVFSGWAAGYQKYFFFQPSISFAAYTYTLELEEYADECYAQDYIAASSCKLSEGHDYDQSHQKLRVLYADVEMKNLSSQALYVKGYYIVLDHNGEIFLVSTHGGGLRQSGLKISSLPLCSVPWSETLVWPEELKGDVNAIFVVTSVTPS